jgi:tetratricopeptide (TPR) repeat protein
MNRVLAAFLICLAPLVADAACSEAPDHSEALAALADAARAAETEAEGREISGQMWELWLDAPDEEAKAVLDRGMRMRSSYDLLGAVAEFTRLVAHCPDYAEGYNQRAFAHYLREDFVSARADLDKAIELSPTHVGALSGRALARLALGEIDGARADLRAALALNPWLSERHLLAKGAPLAPPGDDI